MATPANWFPDPYGRFAQRYWDGAAWTAHVIDGDGKQSVDPMGTSTVTPIVLPQTATGTGSSGPAAQGFAAPLGQPTSEAGPLPDPNRMTFDRDGDGDHDGDDGAALTRSAPLGWSILDRMAPDSVRRPAPRVGEAIAGVGGAVAAVGIGMLFIGDGFKRGLVLLAAAIVLAAAVAIRLFVPAHREARAAAVGAGVVGIGFLTLAMVGENPSKAWIPFLVAAALFLIAWLLPGFFGRPLMLGLAAGALIFGIAAAFSPGNDRSCDPSSFDCEASSGPALPFGGVDLMDSGVALLVCSGLMLAGVVALDRKGYRGTATPIAGAALVGALGGLGLSAAYNRGSTASLLALLVGAALATVGAVGRRRATAWSGATLIGFGAIGLISNSIKPESTRGSGGTALLCGALLIAGAFAATAIIRSNRATPAAPSSDGSGAPR